MTPALPLPSAVTGPTEVYADTLTEALRGLRFEIGAQALRADGEATTPPGGLLALSEASAGRATPRCTEALR